MRLRFGDCLLDTDSHQLFRAGCEARLPPKAYSLLQCLLAERPRVLAKEQLYERLWHDAFVTDASLANLVSSLRKAIGDDGGEHRLLRTVHGVGYAFCGEVTEVAEPLAEAAPERLFRLVFLDREIALHEGENLLGRGKDVVAWIDDPNVSRNHARIVVGPQGAELEDLGSKNGTLLNGSRVVGRVPLHDKDEMRLGSATLILRVFWSGLSTATSLEGQPG
jgi:DNA-binding winged helix-turn-helix (wHTH) protein